MSILISALIAGGFFFLASRFFRNQSNSLVHAGVGALTLAIFAASYFALPSVLSEAESAHSDPRAASNGVALTPDEEYSLKLRDTIIAGETSTFKNLIRTKTRDYNRSILAGTYCNVPCEALNLLNLIAENDRAEMIRHLAKRAMIKEGFDVLMMEAGLTVGSLAATYELASTTFTIEEDRHRALVKLVYGLDPKFSRSVARYGKPRGSDLEPLRPLMARDASLGWTNPLHEAIARREKEEILYQKNKFMNCVEKDSNGNNALMLAAFIGDVEVYDALSTFCVTYFSRNDYALTAEDIARLRGNTAIENSLKKRTKSHIKSIQRKLANLGYKITNIDGEYGPELRSAIWQVQRDNKWTIDGELSRSFWCHLYGCERTRGR